MLCNYLLLPFVELEIRLGTYNNNKFDSNVDKRYFEKIQEILMSGIWEKIEDTVSVEYIKDSVKIINNEKAILKENVLNETISLKNSPFDFRFSINQEFKLPLMDISKNDSLVRSKNRESFFTNTFRYDLTVVNQKLNNVNILKHEIEIELLVTPETLTWTSEYINDFFECKIYDLINIVEPIERNDFKINLF